MQLHCERHWLRSRGALMCVFSALIFMRPGLADRPNDINGLQGELTRAAFSRDLKSIQGFSSNVSEAIQRLVEVPTITRLTLDGTMATAHVSLNASLLAASANIVPQLLRICPEGNVCWKTDLGGPCLGNTPIASAGVSLNGTFGQASFDYSDVLDVGTSFLAVAAYQGSLLCKAAASDNADQPPPQGMFMRLTTSLTLTSTYAAATEGVTFNVVLTNAVPDGQPIKGRNVIIDFGDGSEVATVVTATDGSASVQHKHATSGFFNATASFQGDRRYQPSSAMDIVHVGPETSSTMLTVTPMTPVATENATFVITLQSRGPDMPPIAGAAITVDFGDGTSGTGTTDANGQLTLTHSYAVASTFKVKATFAGDATYSQSSGSITVNVGLERASTSLAVATMSPVATEDITFALVLRSAVPGMPPPLAGKPITVSFGDGSSANSTTDGTGSVTVTHVYAQAGTYQVTASFAGDATYYASAAATTIAPGLETSSTSLSVAPMSPVATEDATFLIALKSGGPGTPALSGKTVSVDFGDGVMGTGVTDSTGQVTLTHTYNAVGAFSVVAHFAGDATYSASSSTVALAVGAATSTTSLAVATMSPVATEDITFALALSSDASGMPPLAGKTITVSFGDGTSANSTTDGAGISSVTHVYATAGTYQVTATFAGNAIYSASSAATTVAPGLETSSTSLSVAPMSPVVTESATFLIALESGGPGTPPLSGKTVSVDFGDGPIETGVTDSTGQVTLMHTYNVTGAFSVVASFAGDATYSASSTTEALAVGAEKSVISLAVTPSSPVATESATFVVTVTSGGPGTPPLVGKLVTVTFGDATGTFKRTDENGRVTLTHTYGTARNLQVAAYFAGDDTYSGSSTSAQITVGPESSSTSLVGTPPGGVATEDATIVITLTSGGPGMPRLPGRSIFVDFGDGSDISTPTDGAGSLVLKHPYATAGLKTLVATFPGDQTYSGSSANQTLTIDRESSTISISVTPTSPEVNQAATVTVLLQSGGPGTPGIARRSITLNFDNGANATYFTDDFGVLTITHTFTIVRPATITASFGGDGTYSGSAVSIVVNVIP